MKKVGKLNIIHDKLTYYERKFALHIKSFAISVSLSFKTLSSAEGVERWKIKVFPFFSDWFALFLDSMYWFLFSLKLSYIYVLFLLWFGGGGQKKSLIVFNLLFVLVCNAWWMELWVNQNQFIVFIFNSLKRKIYCSKRKWK